MKIVLQCAGSKVDNAGSMLDSAGKPVKFVAHPETSDVAGPGVRPDDEVTPGGKTWRDQLQSYNAEYQSSGRNPLNLLPAGRLYTPQAYARLRERFKPEDIFILSAGWGLVRSDYLLPDYDITFSKNAGVAMEKRRSLKEPGWHDFNQLREFSGDGSELHFFGGTEYLRLFYKMCSPPINQKIVIHHKVNIPHVPGYAYRRYEGSVSTNWHYVALSGFLQA